MGEGADCSARSTDGNSPSEAKLSEDDTGRQILLEEARTAARQQLGQLDKIDHAAVQTAKITFLLAGILAGGSRLPRFPSLGLLGAFSLWSLVASLLGSLYVYGTSRLFVGSEPAELGIEYEESPTAEATRVEVIREYEDGIRLNWCTLYTNGFVLAGSRILLGLAVIFAILGIGYSS